MTSVFSLRSSCLTLAPLVPHESLLPKPVPHAELLFLPLRYGVASAMISADVEYEGSGFGAVQLGHDMGYMIPHVPYGPPTPILAAHIAFSSCTAQFGKATILVNDEQAAWWHVYAMLQVCADPIALPLGFNLSAIWTTVHYGFSWGDLICGMLRVGVDAASSYVTSKIFSHKKIEEVQEAWARRMADSLYPHIGPSITRLGVGRFKVGYHNDAVISGVVLRASQAVPVDLVGRLSGEAGDALRLDPWSELSIQLDRALADEPPPLPGPSPLTGLLDPVPVLE